VMDAERRKAGGGEIKGFGVHDAIGSRRPMDGGGRTTKPPVNGCFEQLEGRKIRGKWGGGQKPSANFYVQACLARGDCDGSAVIYALYEESAIG